MTGERKAPLPALTGLRFFLALWVVLDHAHTSFAITRFQYPAGIIFDAGYVAVGAFFALSGFILSYNYSLDDFWSRKKVIGFGVARFSRVFPSHCFAVVSLTPLVFFYVVSHFSMLKLGIAMGTGILSLTMLQAWIPAATLTWNPPAWSLSNEIFFYCCFPFAGILLWRLSSPLSICVSGLLLWMAALAIPLLAFQNHYSANFVRYNPVVRIPEFLAGILIGRAFYLLNANRHWLRGRGLCLYAPAIIIELLVILPLQLQVDQSLLMRIVLHNGLLLPLHLMIILGLALDGGFPARILSGRVLSFLGEASYSMYIVHYPLFRWITVILKQLHLPQLHGYRGALLYVGAVICVAALMIEFVERPFTRLIRRKWHNGSRATAGVARVPVLPVPLIRKPG